jgi:hypothetical protein
MEKLLKLVACMFLARSHYYAMRKDFERSGSYKTAYHLLCYAIHDREDCIGNFDFYEPASDLLFQHPYMDVWDYEEIYENFFKEWVDNYGPM